MDPRSRTRSTLLLAQELTLRQLTADLGLPLDRQTSVNVKGNVISFDGGVIRDGKLTAIEVRAVRGSSARFAAERTVRTGLREAARLFGLGVSAEATRFILAIVFIEVNEEDAIAVKAKVASAVAELTFPVEVRYFDLEQLRRTFGAPAA